MKNSSTLNNSSLSDLTNQFNYTDAQSRWNSLGNISLQNNFMENPMTSTAFTMPQSQLNFPPLSTVNSYESLFHSSQYIQDKYPYLNFQNQEFETSEKADFNLARYLNQTSIFADVEMSQQYHQKCSVPPHRTQIKTSKPELRRNSLSQLYVSSSLQPVHESDLSPISFVREQKSKKNQQIQQRIDKNFSTNVNANNTSALKFNRKFSLDSSNNQYFPRFRGSSSSIDSSSSTNRLEINDEKLAKTGNVFHRREDWSIISKVPINKQNTIDIRLEDEGPYGNDETRCFVLSHFSSMGVKDLSCIVCGCELLICDRFPLIDGTLFVSPFLYDEQRTVPALISNKKKYIYSICLKCLDGSTKGHEIKCKFCHKSWTHGRSLQIGTLYKFDIFAATPCCQTRIVCKCCKKPLTDLASGGLPYFSMYSEQIECEHCKTNDLHFIKPFNDIFEKSN